MHCSGRSIIIFHFYQNAVVQERFSELNDNTFVIIRKNQCDYSYESEPRSVVNYNAILLTSQNSIYTQVKHLCLFSQVSFLHTSCLY